MNSPLTLTVIFTGVMWGAAALTGGPRWGWLPNLLLWAALVMGVLCGAAAYHWINLAAIWFAAGAALALSAMAAATTRSAHS